MKGIGNRDRPTEYGARYWRRILETEKVHNGLPAASCCFGRDGIENASEIDSAKLISAKILL